MVTPEHSQDAHFATSRRTLAALVNEKIVSFQTHQLQSGWELILSPLEGRSHNEGCDSIKCRLERAPLIVTEHVYLDPEDILFPIVRLNQPYESTCIHPSELLFCLVQQSQLKGTTLCAELDSSVINQGLLNCFSQFIIELVYSTNTKKLDLESREVEWE